MAIEPLAQDYVVVARTPSPEVFTGEVSLTHVPDGTLLAGYKFWSRGGFPPWSLKQACSRDGGRNWDPLPALDLCDGMPFVHGGGLYLLANNRGELTADATGRQTHGGPPQARDIVISRSDDGGQSWVAPVTLFEGSYWNAPTGYAVENGRLYRAFDVPNPGLAEDGVAGRSNVVVVGDLSRDLLEPAAWRISPPVGFPGVPASLKRGLYTRIGEDRWLEPNVVCVRGKLRVIARARIDYLATAGVCAVCDIADDGENLSHRFVQFHPMPGGQCKFFIIHDEASDLFWTPANLITNSQDVEWGERLKAKGFHQSPGNERRFLMLLYSLDALNWFQAGCIAMSKSPLQSFHYAAPLIEGDDLLILSRTSSPNARHQHDSDLVTFHRVRDFRGLALDLHSEV